MNITLAIVLGATGAILILVGVIGGNFTISVISMPRVGVAARIVSFVLGGLLVVSSLGVYTMEIAPVGEAQPGPTSEPVQADSVGNSGTVDTQADPSFEPVSVSIVAPEGYDINLFSGVETSSSVVSYLSHGQHVTILCTMQGESVASDINNYESSLWDGVVVDGTDIVGFIPDVYVNTHTYQPVMPNCGDVWNAIDA